VETSFEDALKKAKIVEPEEIFVIGGAQLYAAALPYADRLYLTRVHVNCQGDVFFPEYDEKEWVEIYSIFKARNIKNQYNSTFTTLIRTKRV
jgi:dihydrofolate reductase